jgi:hypothetical protein
VVHEHGQLSRLKILGVTPIAHREHPSRLVLARSHTNWTIDKRIDVYSKKNVVVIRNLNDIGADDRRRRTEVFCGLLVDLRHSRRVGARDPRMRQDPVRRLCPDQDYAPKRVCEGSHVLRVLGGIVWRGGLFEIKPVAFAHLEIERPGGRNVSKILDFGICGVHR